MFFHPLSHGDDNEMFDLAAETIKTQQAEFIVVNGSEGQALGDNTPGKAWAGKDEYILQLTNRGVKPEQIVLSQPAYHTRQNNDMYTQVAAQRGWKTAVTLNQPQQLLRATLGQIKAMEQQNYWMRVYSIYPEPWEANKEIFGPQGASQTKRFKLIGPEFDRILNYQKKGDKGDLASFDELFDYISRRKTIV